MSENKPNPWSGLRSEARARLETRDYSTLDPGAQLSGPGMPAGQVLARKDELADHWIPGVELFSRKVYQQNGRGYFAELTRLNEGTLDDLGLAPKQWASALMHRDSAKGFHIHPPHVPEGVDPSDWFQDLYVRNPEDLSKRPYDKEQWDVMIFLTGIGEMILVDERQGMPRRIMRFTIPGDSRQGPDNMAVVIPPGVGHALRDIGNEDLIMVYGTSTTFNPAWEGRVASDIEKAPLPSDWDHYLSNGSASD